MRKLSETLKESNTPLVETEPWQSLILFDDVLDGDKIVTSPEVEKLMVYFYGQPRVSIAQTQYAGDLQDWLRDELYKADVNCRAMIYPFKAPFEDLALETHKKNYSAPLNLQIFHPDIPIEFDILVLTCTWEDDGQLFKNYSHIIGVIADNDDLATIVDEYVRRD